MTKIARKNFVSGGSWDTFTVPGINKLIYMNLIEWTGTSKSDTQGRYILKK